VLLAFQPAGEIEALVKACGLPRLCTNTITEWPVLQADLAAIVQQGYAVSIEETDPGAWGVATPILDGRGRVVAAIGLAGPMTRYSEDNVRQWVALCRQAAEAVGRLMGYGGEAAAR
jgi:DNA-binding IclR family transcriptional regulator